VEATGESGGGYLDAGDTVASPGSWKAAATAAGASIGAVDAVMRDEATASFAVVRPLGHHATPTEAMGFCIINNAAVAAAHAREVYGLKRILLVDFDVHHGNGTQDTFYHDPTVLYFSSHQYPAYPGTGALDETGIGEGAGFTVNVPLPAYVGDAGFIQAYETILRPIADRFEPELVIVSAGYDAHWRNSAYVHGIHERMTVSGLSAISRILQEITEKHCPGKLAGILEGGYDLEALAYGVCGTLRTWLGDTEIDDPIGPPPAGDLIDPDITELLDKVKKMHGI
jgi:acetoin utilization deacetylase AcuC-like enzyme